jgi:hypothetical protein
MRMVLEAGFFVPVSAAFPAKTELSRYFSDFFCS